MSENGIKNSKIFESTSVMMIASIRPSTSGTVVNAAQMKDLIVENRHVTFGDLLAALESYVGSTHKL